MTTTPEAMQEDEWTYVGRRILNTGKLAHGWTCGREDHEAEHLFIVEKGDRKRVIGGTYVVKASETHETVVFPDTPMLHSAEHPDRALWIAKDREALAWGERERAEAAAKRLEGGGIGKMTLDEARRWVNLGPTTTRTARLAIVLRWVAA